MNVRLTSIAYTFSLTRTPTSRRLSVAALRTDMEPQRHANSTREHKARQTRTRWKSESVWLQISQRIQETQPPTVVMTRKYLGGVKDALSLGQGFVYWDPPQAAIEAAQAAVKDDPSISVYGPDEGLPQLRERLRQKISTENGLREYDVMVTAGANQAFVNCLLTLCDQGDGVVLFKPFYFNHAMAIQMTGSAARLIEGPCDTHTLLPDLDWLEQRCQQPDPPKVAVIISPNNPTGEAVLNRCTRGGMIGAVMPREDMERAAEICGRYGVWLIKDNAYEYFTYNGLQHHCIAGPHILHIFSFSKSYGMMGWRVGYIAYPKYNGDTTLEQSLVKVQDTIVVCVSQMSQHLALACLSQGQEWVKEKVESLDRELDATMIRNASRVTVGNRAAALDALSPLGTMGNGIYGGQGALYLWAKLPDGYEEDESVVQWLARKHGICVIPGNACGSPGYIRVAFANQPYEKCLEACQRLRRGLEELRESPSLDV